MEGPDMKNSYLEKEKIEKQLRDLLSVAEKNQWRLSYDKFLDCLYISEKFIPQSTQLYTVGGEYTLYIGKNSKVRGIMIEYFNSNYLKHASIKPTKAKSSYSWSVKKQKPLMDKLQQEIVKNFEIDIKANPHKFVYAAL